MNNKLVSYLLKKLEVLGVIFLLLSAESINIPFLPPVILNVASYGITFFLIFGRVKRLAYVGTRDISLVFLLLFAVASVLWSVSIPDTVAQIRAAVRSILFGVYLAMRYTPREQIRLLYWVTSIAIILCFAVCLAAPSYGISDELSTYAAWQGIFNHKQLLGRFMSFATSIFIITALDEKSNRWIALTWLCLAVILILLAQSKTALMTFVVLVLLIPLYRIAEQKRPRALPILVLLFLVSTVAIIISLNLKTIVVDILGKSLEINGRTPIWTLAIEKGMERPFLGYGYNAFWTSEASDVVIRNTWIGNSDDVVRHVLIFHAHNAFIDLFVQLGLIGLMLFLYSFITSIIRVFKLILITRKIEYFWMLQFLAHYFIYNMIEGVTILPVNNILWITYISVALSSIIDYSRIKTKIANNYH